MNSNLVEQLTVRLPVREAADVVIARQQVRALAEREGLTPGSVAALATATSEIVWNVIVHAGSAGEVLMGAVSENGRRAIVIVARDAGRGIPSVELALRDGYSTARGLGLGLPSAKRLTDEFEIESTLGGGTVIMLKRWIT